MVFAFSAMVRFRPHTDKRFPPCASRRTKLYAKFCTISVISILYSNGYIVPMEFCVRFFPRISAFSRRIKMHLNGMLLIGTEIFKIIVPL